MGSARVKRRGERGGVRIVWGDGGMKVVGGRDGGKESELVEGIGSGGVRVDWA